MKPTGMSRGLRGSVLWLGVALAVWAAAAGNLARAEESWDAVYLGGAKAGYVHTFLENVEDKGRKLVRVRVDLVLDYKRLNDRVTTRLVYGTIETPDGKVLRLDTRTQASNLELRAHGDVIDGKMNLRLEGTGQRQEQTIDWPDDIRGPYAAEQSFSRKPMQPGETRTLKMYMPDLNRICDLTLKARSTEEVRLGGGVTRNLLRVDQSTQLDGKPRPEFDTALWVDAQGQVLKSVNESLGGMVTYRTTREGAMSPNTADAGGFDQIANSVIKVKNKLTAPEGTREVVYRITHTSEDPSKLIPNDNRQTVRPGSRPNEAILVVRTGGPNSGEPGTESVGEEFLRPNAMITSADARVTTLAARAVGKATDPWEKAKAIERWVFRNVRDKNFSIAFAPASEVARDLSGDCTEHGVLTAAMCRAQGVPARVVVGLVYAEKLGGFGFHLWNEVYVNRRWVAIDAAFNQDDVDAVHIKLAESSLDGVAPFETFLPIVRVLGKTSIDPVEIR